MSFDTAITASDGTDMTTSDLVAYTQKELDAEAQRLTEGISNGEVSQARHMGATLDYSSKSIKELPVEVITLFKDRIERLALSHNPHISIPREIVQCHGLRYLNMRATKLVEFPAVALSLTQLEILDVSKNEIATIPESIKSMNALKFLAFARNKVKRLPLAFGEMPNLHKLKFHDNPIEFPSLEELQLPEDRKQKGMSEAEKDKEICLHVKRVLKTKALRQRLLRTTTDDEASESNVETPRPPRRLANGRFPVRPSLSGIDNLGDLIRSASSSPPDGTQLTAKQTFSSTPIKHSMTPTSAAFPDLQPSVRMRSESASTTASIRARRQGFVPGKRSTELNSVSETTNGTSVRSSNASTIKAMHAYKLSTASTLSGIGSSSGADSSSEAVSPVNATNGDLRRPAGHKHRMESLQTTRSQQTSSVLAARRLKYVLHQLHKPLHQLASSISRALARRSDLARHLSGASSLLEQLDKALVTLDQRHVKEADDAAMKRQIMFYTHSALNSFGLIMETLHAHIPKFAHILDPLHVRGLMFQIHTSTIEARNVVQLLGVPIKYAVGKPQELIQQARVSNAWSSRTVTPTEVKPVIANKRLRGATILRNEASNGALRVIPPSKSVDVSRSNTMTSFLTSATPVSAEFGALQSAVLPSRSNTMMHHSSDEHDDNSDHLEAIFLKLRAAHDIASKTLPACQSEINMQIDNAARDGSRAGRLWQIALKSYKKVARANQEIGDRLSALKLKDPGVRHQKDFWQLCDSFVQSWMDFAIDVKELSSARFDITTIRSLMKPMQRVVKDVSKTISDSPLYHHALKGTPAGPRALAPPFSLGLNTASAQAVAHLGSNPPSAAPSSATTVSVPATPLTAALGPAAQSTLTGTPGAAPPMLDYFTKSDMLASAPPTIRNAFEHSIANLPPVNLATAPQTALPPIPTSSQNHAYGRR